jgi:hypothetical protein
VRRSPRQTSLEIFDKETIHEPNAQKARDPAVRNWR